MNLKGKVAIITGSSSGIGRATAIRFAKEGAKVVVNSHKNLEECMEVVNEIKKKKGEAIAVVADISKQSDVNKLINETVKAFGRLDIMVNNAGVLDMTPFTEITEEKWDFILDVNLKGVFLCSQAAAKQMIKQNRGGKIVNIASIAALIGIGGIAHYCSSKAGMLALTRVAAIELAQHKINVNAIAPGLIETAMTQGILENPEQKKGFLSLIPMHRAGQPEEIAAAVAFLSSDDADYITGTCLIVDGGWTIQ